MLFFVGNDGTIKKSFPEPVYQGAAGANEIFIVAPFAYNLSAAAAFKLPNGVLTEPYLLTPVGEIPDTLNKVTGAPYRAWKTSLVGEITAMYGTVTAQFYFYASGGAVTATSYTSFSVGRGVPAVLPEKPTGDIYAQILAALSNIQSDLDNGFFSARAFLPWRSAYVYGLNELVWYPGKGTNGSILKSLTSNNTNDPYDESGKLNTSYWQEILDFTVVANLYNLQAALERAQTAANSAEGFADAAEQSAQNAKQTAEEFKEALVDYATKEELDEAIEPIQSLIPAQATPSNQLADKEFVNSSINSSAAFYITKNAEGDPFATKAELTAATTFYSGGQVRVPTRNDYCTVLSDESQSADSLGKYPTTRYVYQGVDYPDGQWELSFVVNATSFTAAQLAALNSGITQSGVARIEQNKEDIAAARSAAEGAQSTADTAKANAATAQSAAENAQSTADAKYTKPSDGIPYSDLSEAVQASLDKADSATGNGEYLPLAGGSMEGSLNYANNTWNAMGDDCYIGDQNVAGTICIQGDGGTNGTGLRFFTNRSDNAGNPGDIFWKNNQFSSNHSWYVSDLKVGGDIYSRDGRVLYARRASLLGDFQGTGTKIFYSYDLNDFSIFLFNLIDSANEVLPFMLPKESFTNGEVNIKLASPYGGDEAFMVFTVNSHDNGNITFNVSNFKNLIRVSVYGVY